MLGGLGRLEGLVEGSKSCRLGGLARLSHTLDARRGRRICLAILVYSFMLLHTRAVSCPLATAGGLSSAVEGGAGRGEDGVVRRLVAFGKQRCSGRLAPPHVAGQASGQA